MDALSDLLRAVKLNGALFLEARFTSPWCVEVNPGKGAAEWLREHQLASRPRLAEGLRVESGWELAVETVLGADLQAVLLDDFNGLDLKGFDQGELRLVSAPRHGDRVAGSLMDKVEASLDLSPWLARVRSLSQERRPG